jgi:hypothetical protein
VWTPKRILLLAAGFAVFLTAYVVYAYFLGGIDGLKPLPGDYQPIVGLGPVLELTAPPASLVDEKLRLAFGTDCDEIKNRKNKIDLGAKGMVLAVQSFEVLKDGRVKLTPFSLALFRKETANAKYPEINTVQCNEAYVTFDRPVSNLAEMANRKIVAGELRGDIYVMNNRRTPQRDDDISLFTQGPLHYDEARHLIYTAADVRLTDPQSKPKPMTMAGTGLDIYLTADTKSGTSQPGAAAKSKGRGPNGVDRVRIRNDVQMNLWVDAKGFLESAGTGKDESEPDAVRPGNSARAMGQKTAKPEATKPDPPSNQSAKKAPVQPEKAQVVIITQGPFEYDPRTDQATFDIVHNSGARPNVVTVDRLNEREGKLDHLACDHLELQFHRKAGNEVGESAESRAEALDIETARATGKDVIVTSDAAVLEAHGTDFFYDKRARLSTLRGDPQMWALKEGNEIHAPELQLLDSSAGQQATALGEGYISILDKVAAKRQIEAHWKQKLVYGKDGKLDLLTLYGDAAFVDNENGQRLQADTLKVWMEPPPVGKEGPAASKEVQAGANPTGRKPHHLEAIGHVQAHSPELHVHETERFVVRFKDAPPMPAPSPAVRSEEQVPPDGAPGVKPPEQETKDNRQTPPGRPGRASDNAPKTRQPIDLSARFVLADVLTYGNRSDLEKLLCEGAVQVHQDPAGPDERGVDIRGETLELQHKLDGNILTVTGDHARVQLDKIDIVGPQVNIDQTANEAWVDGMGVMRMPSKANFDGSPLAHEADLTIHWQKRMYFDGQNAEFRGNVQAEQNNGHVACKKMQVVLDKRMSLREGNRGAQSAKVQKLVCEDDVWIEDSSYRDKDKRLVSNNRIHCPLLGVDNEVESNESIVSASGPGLVRIFQLGTKGETFPAGRGPGLASGPVDKRAPKSNAKPVKPEEEEYKLTQIGFEGRMVANNKNETATFYDHVVVLNLPTEDCDLPLDESRPPKDGFYLSCEKLIILRHRQPDGTTQLEMQAHRRVKIIGPDFAGSAEEVKYDETKDQLILVGSEGDPALLDKQETKGGDRKRFKGKLMIYAPKTGDLKGDGIREISFIK